jgi:glycopeptide antibiotics resistance protein
MEQLWRAFSGIVPLFCIAIPVVIIIGLILLNKRINKGLEKKKAIFLTISDIFLLLSIIGVILVTLLPGSLKSIQLIPLVSIWDVLMNSVDYTVPIRILGFNIILFIPFGLFFALRMSIAFNSSNVILKTALVGMLFSLTVEILQLVLPIGRTSNIDDIILNTIGALTGGLVGTFINKKYIK